ncbi:MAG: hypothetical protein A3F96_00905 [Parcubacteria group bacterium RIFCSPLOWO2_12_FULL_40_10]|nr:MAG: hypothetical protein A3F96_00905 [Parcubacteria group bacterium RIFCSPLOWO2_12_FULL_40_10]
MKTLIIIPTYNEIENIPGLIKEIFGFDNQLSVMVVDDDSPDGTAGIVQELRRTYFNLLLLQRRGTRGFGQSYLEGFKKIINENYEIIVIMDADFSHDYKEIPEMVRKFSDCDTVVGSRYVQGGKIKNWNWRRRLLSRFANFYASSILSIPIYDSTTGFMCFKKDVLKKINLDSIKSEGYAFLVELKYKIFKAGYKITEHPIVFTERREGESKMSFKNIWEAIFLPWKLRFSRN